ncbi:hypothetical protein JTB14_008392 [Gonioctena quinquepunctata]|nr:hypothetical protein JTB14_008392 [Gonioctena quinquepunctata]
METSSENYRKAEETLEQIKQKNSTESKHTEIIETPSIEIVENVKLPQNKPTNGDKPPPSLYPVINIIKNPAVKKLKITQISQTDGPTDTSDGYTSRSEDESDRDLSMRRTNNQTKRNVKRRKTSRTKEEIEIDQEERKTMLERVEKENTKTAMQKNAQKTKLTKKDKNEEKAPYQEQMDQPPQGRNDKAPPPINEKASHAGELYCKINYISRLRIIGAKLLREDLSGATPEEEAGIRKKNKELLLNQFKIELRKDLMKEGVLLLREENLDLEKAENLVKFQETTLLMMRGRMSNMKISTVETERVCYTCGKPGHLAR